MSLGLRLRLSAMMFLQYFVWGIWLPMLGQHLTKGNFTLTKDQIGWIFTVYGFGAIIGPFLLGQIADRYVATEKVMSAAHFLGGLILIYTAYQTKFWPIFWLLFLYCNLYMPTMGLSNSITFRNLGENGQSYFPGIRLWGTIGWIVAGLFFGLYLEMPKLSFYETVRPIFDIAWIGAPSFRDCLRIAGVMSILYSLYCLTLPHTPPIPAKADDPIDKKSAILESLELFRFRSFAVLVIVAGLIGIMLAFYFACETFFLEAVGIPAARTGAYMTIGQVAELVVMAFVPWAVNRLGYKTTMIIGASAWAVRFGLSALGQPQWLMISTIALHGFAFGFFFVAAQMYVDRAASADIKATAQNLLIFVIYGLGTILGSVLTGRIRNYFTTRVEVANVVGLEVRGLSPHMKRIVESGEVENWTGIWMGPFILTIVCIIIFALLFREREIGDTARPSEQLSQL